MKRFLQNMAIRRKHALVLMMTSGAALLLASAAVIVHATFDFRKQLLDGMNIVAGVVGSDTRAALDFNDPKSAEESLASLQAEPSALAACVYDREGKIFATYRRAGLTNNIPFPPMRAAGHEFRDGRMYTFHALKEGAATVGGICIISSLEQLPEHFKRYAVVVALVFVVAMLLAFFVSSRLQWLILESIRHLAVVTRAVAAQKNYSLRAQKEGGDEIGQLVDGLNEMLAQIQARDAELQMARDNLERRVEQRTEDLQQEVEERRRAQEALQESQALYSSLVEQLPMGVFRKDREGRYVFLNSWFCRLKDIQPGEMLDKTPKELAAAELSGHKTLLPNVTLLADQGTDHHKTIMETGRQIEMEEEYPAVEGRPQYLQVVKLPVFGPDGKTITGSQGIMFDITARKQAELALQESQALYHSLVEQMPTGIFRKDMQGRYVFVNSRFCQIKCVKPEQVLGKIPAEVVAAHSAAGDAAWNAKLRREGADHHQSILQNGRHIEVEEEYLGPDGQVRHLHVVKLPVFGPDGRITGSQGVMIDITERKRAEAEAAYERDLLSALMDSLPDVIYFKDLESRFVRVSASKAEKEFKVALSLHRDAHPGEGAENLPAHLRSLEQFTRFMMGKTDADFLPEAPAHSFSEEEQEIIRTGKPLIGDLVHAPLLNGKTGWYLRTKMPWRDKNGKIVGTFGISKDVTSIKEAQAELAYERDLFQALMENFPDTIYFKDRQSKFVRVSRTKLEKALEFCLEQHRKAGGTDDDLPDHLRGLDRFAGYMIGKSDLDFMLPEVAGAVHEEEQKIIRTGKPVIGEVTRVTLLDGKVVWFLSSKLPWKDKNGNIVGVFGTSKDVTSIKEAEAKLAEASALMTTLLASTPDHIYFKDRESRFIRCSASMAHLFKVDNVDEVVGRSDHDFFAEEHAKAALEDERKIISTEQPVIGKMEKETWPDGRVTWALTTKMPLRDGNNHIIGTFGISKDVTPLKEAEAKLKQVHSDLVQTSRRAGMADVATSVLHNVGNVLNSVNTSAGLIADRLRKSKMPGISRVVAMFEEHEHDFAEFISQEGRCNQLTNYLKTLSQHLVTEQAAMLGEVQDLNSNVEHIKEIVAMQQSYAKVTGVRELQSPSVLMEDALRMHAAALVRHEVKVVRQYENLPDVSLDKHKVLQILINLISNAKYAMTDTPADARRLTVGVANGSDRIRFIVSDNGTGIAAENLTRIFSLGFTTRDNGHGFGLHSGFLSAREMGGELHAHSAGPGHGATFTLELPVQAE